MGKRDVNEGCIVRALSRSLQTLNCKYCNLHCLQKIEDAYVPTGFLVSDRF